METQPNSNDFATLEEIQKGIEILENTDWLDFLKNSKTVKEVWQATSDKLKLHLNNFYWLIYPHNLREGNLPIKFFRVRPVDQVENVNDVSGYFHPQIENTRHNRANYPKHPVLYCSENPATALVEVVKDSYSENREREYYVSSWKLKENSNEVRLIPLLYDCVSEDSLFKKMGENILASKIDELFNPILKNESSKIAGIKETLKYYSRAFVNDQQPYYPISSFLGHQSLYQGMADLLLYPSIQTERKTINIAISPQYAKSNMYLKYIVKVKLKPFDVAGSLSLDVNHFAIVDDSGKIKWRRVDLSDEDYKKVCVDFGLRDRIKL